MSQKQLRILIVTHAPLSPEFGAGQIALNLAESLRNFGHTVKIWSAKENQGATRWWQDAHSTRKRLDLFIDSQEPFDVIDVPAYLLTPRIGKSRLSVTRSVQPELLYLVHNFNYPQADITNPRHLARLAAVFLHSIYYAWLVISGWCMAKHILCLGSIEHDWMSSWFPWWRSKMKTYLNAISDSDQYQLSQIRKRRQTNHRTSGLRFLWIGRWHPQKGTDELLKFLRLRAESCPGDTFTIAGYGIGADLECPQDLIRSGRLSLISSFSREQLAEMLASHDVGLLTSRVEGWGLSLNEMLESGMVVFSTYVGGVQDLGTFFPNALRSFPPPIEIELCTEAEGNWLRYYTEVSMPAIARKYIQSISAELSVS